jgi:hypothetical protein
MSALLWLLTLTAQAEPLAILKVTGPDTRALLAEDALRPPKSGPERFAVPRAVGVDQAEAGAWVDVGRGFREWRLPVQAKGAKNLNIHFSNLVLPKGATLELRNREGNNALGRTVGNRELHGRTEWWSPVVEGDQLTVVVRLPAVLAPALRVELGEVYVGYKAFGPTPPPAGSCNNDTVCPEGDDWREEIASVAVYGMSGSLWCTGFMVNNTAEDQTPYFQTADHCGLDSRNDSSLVVYWNFESPVCGDLSGGSLDDWQSGSTFRAGYSTSDFTLVELDDVPDPAWQVSWAGWDRSGDDATEAVCIHHPNTDEKAISFEYDGTVRTDAYDYRSDSSGSHVMVEDWDDGTTEGGSSGAPLFNQDHRVIGNLTGGGAACGNNEADWFGGFASSWTGGGRSTSRLSDWLDPSATGVEVLDTLAPWSQGLLVSPSDALVFEGPEGGPFTGEASLSLTNRGDGSLDWSATTASSWLVVRPNSGTLAGGASTNPALSISGSSLSPGLYTTVLFVENTTDGIGNVSIPVSLIVGERSDLYSFDMSSDPGWTTEGDWAWGVPTGDGGSTGSRDPSRGHTGSEVYGYNLSGDYDNRMSAQDLTTPNFDLTNVTGARLGFWRWLGVEESDYDHAVLSVQVAGGSWTTLYENSGAEDDGAWVYVEYNLPEEANGASEVRFRWTMGSTDGDVEYCGWNIDDVVVSGIVVGERPDTGGTDGTDGTTDGADGTTDGADGTTDGADGTTDGADGTTDGADGTTDGADGGTVDTGDNNTDGVNGKPSDGSVTACSGVSNTSGTWLLGALPLMGLLWRRRR